MMKFWKKHRLVLIRPSLLVGPADNFDCRRQTAYWTESEFTEIALRRQS